MIDEKTAAELLAYALQQARVDLPKHFKVAVFVFSENETLDVNAGFVSTMGLPSLRRMVRMWLRASRPEKERVH